MTTPATPARRIPRGYRLGRLLLEHAGIEAALDQVADEIARRNPEPGDLALVGIRRGGVHLANRLATRLEALRPASEVPIGVVDITLYRDDLDRAGANPIIGPTEIPFEIDGITVVLVDDVLYTGRTIRAALDALVDYGRPHGVQLAVLIDRGHRELPIQPDYVGLTVDTAATDQVELLLHEEGGDETAVVLVRDENGSHGG
jgi:pyrimidine operon attenuation protein/uracil phosphoribosyltransferase